MPHAWFSFGHIFQSISGWYLEASSTTSVVCVSLALQGTSSTEYYSPCTELLTQQPRITCGVPGPSEHFDSHHKKDKNGIK